MPGSEVEVSSKVLGGRCLGFSPPGRLKPTLEGLMVERKSEQTKCVKAKVKAIAAH